MARQRLARALAAPASPELPERRAAQQVGGRDAELDPTAEQQIAGIVVLAHEQTPNRGPLYGGDHPPITYSPVRRCFASIQGPLRSPQR